MLEAMLNHVEAGYTANGNPYHNNMHACDVLQTTHYFISQTGLAVSPSIKFISNNIPILVTSFLVVFGNEVTKILRSSLFVFHLVLPMLPCKWKTLYRKSCNLSDEKPKSKLPKYVMSRAYIWAKVQVFAKILCLLRILCKNWLTEFIWKKLKVLKVRKSQNYFFK